MLDFSDQTRTGISILKSTVDSRNFYEGIIEPLKLRKRPVGKKPSFLSHDQMAHFIPPTALHDRAFKISAKGNSLPARVFFFNLTSCELHDFAITLSLFKLILEAFKAKPPKTPHCKDTQDISKCF